MQFCLTCNGASASKDHKMMISFCFGFLGEREGRGVFFYISEVMWGESRLHYLGKARVAWRAVLPRSASACHASVLTWVRPE